jgi:hypothetical protein
MKNGKPTDNKGSKPTQPQRKTNIKRIHSIFKSIIVWEAVEPTAAAQRQAVPSATWTCEKHHQRRIDHCLMTMGTLAVARLSFEETNVQTCWSEAKKMKAKGANWWGRANAETTSRKLARSAELVHHHRLNRPKTTVPSAVLWSSEHLSAWALARKHLL